MNSSFFPFINVTLTARKSIRVLASGLYVAICYFSFIWCFHEEIEVYRILLLVLKLKSFLSSKLPFLVTSLKTLRLVKCMNSASHNFGL